MALDADQTARTPISMPASIAWLIHRIPLRQRRRLAFVSKALVGLAAFFFVSGERMEDIKKWFVPEGCRFIAVDTGERGPSKPRRPCLPGKLVYVQWEDTTPYPSRPRASWSIPNRVLEIEDSSPGKPAVWREQEIIRDGSGRTVWSEPGPIWIAVTGGERIPLKDAVQDPRGDGDKRTGFVLRRASLIEKDGCRQNEGSATIQPLYVSAMEVLIENDGDTTKFTTSNPGIYIRFMQVRCGDELGTTLRTGELFAPYGAFLTRAIRDEE